MLVYINRHPQTEFNKKGITQGHADSPLTEKGREVAEVLGKILKDKNITKIYSSDLGRCLQTSKIINKYLEVEIIQTPKLRERNHGQLNGKPSEFIQKAIDLEDLDLESPGGESFNQMKERVLSFILSLTPESGGPVLLVTHEGCLRAVLSYCKGVSPKSHECDTSQEFVGALELKDKILTKL